ncbi:MAG TPA: UDP-N-acetylmuramate--L-alanine ligase, partial [Candidatus Paceibacterota bacterium]
MSKMALSEISRIHFIGIGGIGMSALARFFVSEKKKVSGSDRSLTPITQALQNEGVQIFTQQVPENITKGIDLVVYTEAMSKDHPEMVAASREGIPMVNYFEALGFAMNPYYLIAVSGTHGKTTTTAMLTDVFEAAGKDPTAIIGSLRAKTKSNFRSGKTKYAIVEACEYKRDFLHLKPDVLVITNVEFEHTDYYKDLADVQSAFRQLVEQVNEGGVVIANTKDPNVAPIIADAPVRVMDYMEFLDFSLPLRQPGVHNRQNAAAAAAVASFEKLDIDGAKAALAQFAGTWRRFEHKGEFQGAPVYDDYAHHPTEIKATLSGARELYTDKRIVAIFEPHTFSRTASLFEEFARAFAYADEVIVMPIYAAREDNVSGVSSRELAVKSLEYNPNVSFVPTYEEAFEKLSTSVGPNDVIVVLGAGTITTFAERLV